MGITFCLESGGHTWETTILDLIMIKREKLVTDLKLKVNLGKSDLEMMISLF